MRTHEILVTSPGVWNGTDDEGDMWMGEKIQGRYKQPVLGVKGLDGSVSVTGRDR